MTKKVSGVGKVRKYLLAILFVLATFSSPVISEASSGPEVKVTTTSLQAKSNASATATNAYQLKQGSLVIVTATKNNYSKINYNGKTAYVLTKSLKSATPTPKVVTRAQGLAVKAAPTASAKTATTLQVKTVVEDYGKANANYHVVQYGSVIGFAHTSAIKKTVPTTKYIKGETVTMYASANTKSVKRHTLSYATAVKVHSTVGSWAYVTTGSKRGYIAKSFLVAKKPVQLKGTKFTYDSIKSKIRYSTTLRDLQGNEVTAHFVALNDTYKVATIDDIWAGVNLGDKLYFGDFQIALQLKGSKDVYFQTFKFESYTYNKTRELVYRVKGKTAKDTDFLVISEVWSSAGEGGDLYFFKNGQLHYSNTLDYVLKPKSIGNQQYQAASYERGEVTGYNFYTLQFNATTGKFTVVKEFPFFDDYWDIGSEHAEKFRTISNYYVK